MSTIPQSVTKALKQAAEYVEQTQPLLDKQAAEVEKLASTLNNYRANVDKTVSSLVELGEIDPSRKSELIDKLAADPSEMCRFVQDFASRGVGAKSLGQPAAGDKLASTGRKLSASDRACLYGDPNADDDVIGYGHV